MSLILEIRGRARYIKRKKERKRDKKKVGEMLNSVYVRQIDFGATCY